MLLSEVSALIKKEIIIELRQKYAINGILLYLAGTVFICYLSFGAQSSQLHPVTWNALFWIILLFTAVSAVAKSFLHESAGLMTYYYTVASGQSIITAKIIYYSLLLVALGLIGFAFYALVLGNPVHNPSLFTINIIFGAVGMATTLTLVSSIAAKAQNNQTLLAVLGLPLLIPVLLMSIKISKNAMDGLEWSASYNELAVIGSIDAIVCSLAIILFPYIWRS
ncbi:MAG: cytochrome C biogenesis protein CcmB [Cyclobacteriaceae bacterium]|nr:MAG: cytochrome C biogenesis protein CcmB [Cyclobacteriaceae bacterium]